MNKVVFLFVLLMVTGCVTKSDVDSCQGQINVLRETIRLMNEQYVQDTLHERMVELSLKNQDKRFNDLEREIITAASKGMFSCNVYLDNSIYEEAYAFLEKQGFSLQKDELCEKLKKEDRFACRNESLRVTWK